jgi:hypothetical protein
MICRKTILASLALLLLTVIHVRTVNAIALGLDAATYDVTLDLSGTDNDGAEQSLLSGSGTLTSVHIDFDPKIGSFDCDSGCPFRRYAG